jgi:hypothetical protein
LCTAGGSSYSYSVGSANAIKNGTATPQDPLTGYSIDADFRYSAALVYTPEVGDTTPDAFTFTDVTNASLSTQYTSNTITVSGITAAAAISISGGSGTYSINGGSYTASGGTVNNGDTVTARVTSSASNSTAVSTTVTIGGVSDTYSVTTLASATINSYPATVRSGDTGVAYTTTGLSAVSSITIGSLAGTSISDTSGDGTHSVPSLTDGVAHELYGTKTVTITGTGGAPTTTTSFQPLSTQSFVTLSGTLNTTETGVLYNFSPAASVGDQIVWTTANGTVDAQGNYAGDFEGTQTMWHIDATDNVARSYDVITGTASAVLKYWNGSAWVAKPLKYWNGSDWVAKTLKYWNGGSWVG